MSKCEAVLLGVLLVIVIGCMKITDYQIASLDKRIKVLEIRASVLEHQAGLHEFKDKK